jgi:hypothetical protein
MDEYIKSSRYHLTVGRYLLFLQPHAEYSNLRPILTTAWKGSGGSLYMTNLLSNRGGKVVGAFCLVWERRCKNTLTLSSRHFIKRSRSCLSVACWDRLRHHSQPAPSPVAPVEAVYAVARLSLPVVSRCLSCRLELPRWASCRRARWCLSWGPAPGSRPQRYSASRGSGTLARSRRGGRRSRCCQWLERRSGSHQQRHCRWHVGLMPRVGGHVITVEDSCLLSTAFAGRKNQWCINFDCLSFLEMMIWKE